jgi:hypothetical protein
MRDKRAFQVAPVLDGRQAAYPWRFWVRGPSFYAAGGYLGHIVKVSFHPNVWLMVFQAHKAELIRTIEPVPGWLHAVSVFWTFFPGALTPPQDEDVDLLFPAAYGWRLSANLLVSTTPTDTGPPIGPNDGHQIWWETLRDGRRVALTMANHPEPEEELEDAIAQQQRAGIFASGFYAEAIEHRFGRQPGNVIVVVPLGPESFKVVEGPL